MKKLIIATSILFAFSATFAQKGKTNKEIPMSSKAPTSVSSNEAKPNMKPSVKPNVKPVGKTPTSTKPAPVVSKVSPLKGVKPVGPSSNRAAASAVGTVNEKNPTKLETKGNNTISKSRAAASAVGTVNEKNPAKFETKKPDADYCKGWKEGYMKAFAKATGEKISPNDVPNCVSQEDCEGYKCGYAAGVKNAEKRIK